MTVVGWLGLLACGPSPAPPAPPVVHPPRLSDAQLAARDAFRAGETERLLAALALATDRQDASAMAEAVIAGRAHDPQAFDAPYSRFTEDLLTVEPSPAIARAAALLYDAARTPDERVYWRDVAHSTLARWRWSAAQRDVTRQEHAGITRPMAHRALSTVIASYVEPPDPTMFEPAITRLTAIGALQAPPEDLSDPHQMLDQLLDAAMASGLSESSAIAETVEAVFSGLDQWTKPVWPAEVAAWQNHHDGVVPGVVGVVVDQDDDGVYVRQLVEGGGAWSAGVHVDDRLLAIDGRPVHVATEAAARLRGENGTKVSLTVSTGGPAEPTPLTITRAQVTPRTAWGWTRAGVHHDVWVAPRVGFVRIASFRPHTEAELVDLLPSPNDLDGLILDLRGNGGGDLEAALKLADRFVDEGRPLIQVESRIQLDRPSGWGFATSPSPWSDVPTVVLVDRQTASSAEIVAGALQAHGATVIGERTTGKGTGQLLRTDEELGFALQFTHLRWRTSDGLLLHRTDHSSIWGIQPDFVDPLTPTERFVVGVLRARREALPVHADGSPMPWRGPEVDPDLPPYTRDPIVDLALSRLGHPRSSAVR